MSNTSEFSRIRHDASSLSFMLVCGKEKSISRKGSQHVNLGIKKLNKKLAKKYVIILSKHIIIVKVR